MPRVMIAIPENFQQADGTVLIPEALRPYTGFDRIGPEYVLGREDRSSIRVIGTFESLTSTSGWVNFFVTPFLVNPPE